MKAKLTKEVVESVPPGNKDKFVWDSKITGFGLKITPKGRRVYVFQYRHPITRIVKRVTIGVHGNPFTPAKARKKAMGLQLTVADDGDPAQDLKDKREQAATTVQHLCDDYLEKHARVHKKPKSVADDESLISRFVGPKLGSKPVITVNTQDIAKFHNDLSETPIQANRALALLSKMFNLAEIPWGYRPQNSNPCKGIKRFQEADNKARRFLTRDELKRLGKALREAENQQNPRTYNLAAIKLLIFTGARYNEIVEMKWEYVRLDEGEVHLPDSKTGWKVLQLPPPAVEVLEELPRIDGNPYVIAGGKVLKGPNKGDPAPLRNTPKVWATIREKAKLDGVRLHDLRHTYGNVGVSSGLGLPIIGAVLGHRNTKTTERYAALGNDPVKDAAEKVATELEAALEMGG